MSDSTFNFNSFIKESVDVLVKPKAYFSTMKTTGGIAEPLIKALLYGVIAGVIALIWSLLKLGAASGLLGGAVGVLALVGYIIGAIIGLFIGAVIMLILAAICKGTTDFEPNVRVTASVMVIMPVSALLGFIGGLNSTVGSIVTLLVNLYALYLIYHALVESLKAKPSNSKVLTIILGALLVIFFLVGLGTKKAASKFLDDFNSEDFQEMIEDLETD
jgi:hypothetical protein